MIIFYIQIVPFFSITVHILTHLHMGSWCRLHVRLTNSILKGKKIGIKKNSAYLFKVLPMKYWRESIHRYACSWGKAITKIHYNKGYYNWLFSVWGLTIKDTEVKIKPI